jgi:hypothetical protein
MLTQQFFPPPYLYFFQLPASLEALVSNAVDKDIDGDLFAEWSDSAEMGTAGSVGSWGMLSGARLLDRISKQNLLSFKLEDTQT